MTFKKLSRNTIIILLVSLAIFLLIYPLSHSIVFMQNDDWIYYKMVSRFMGGSFSINSYVSATFYAQGFLGALFSLIFTVKNLPVLTLIVSVATFTVFTLIMHKHLQKSLLVSILSGLVFFLNPLFVYSIFGFMTENYYMLFFMLTLYFILNFLKTSRRKDFIVLNIFNFISYLIRQFSFVTIGSFLVYLLIKKKYKYAVWQALIILVNLVVNFKLLPKRTAGFDNKLLFGNFVIPYYPNSVFFSSFTYIALFCLPFVVFFVLSTLSTLLKRPVVLKKLSITMFAVGLVVALLCFKGYYPGLVGKTNLYYFHNTLDQAGFFDQDFEGARYVFTNYEVFYKFADSIAKILTVSLIAVFIWRLKKNIDFFSIFFVAHLALLIISPQLYDRYLLPLFPVFILFVLARIPANLHKALSVTVLISLVLVGYLDYNFSMDFVLVQNYVWSKGTEIHEKNKVSSAKIQSTNAWDHLYQNPTKDWLYVFNYDKPDVYTTKHPEYVLFETKKIEYPLSFYVDPYVYVYKRSVDTPLAK